MCIDTETFRQWASTCLPVLLDAAIKGAVLLAAAGVAVTGMRRSSAAARQTVWVLAFAVLLAMPLVSQALPSWQVLPSWANLGLPPPPGGCPRLAVWARRGRPERA